MGPGPVGDVSITLAADGTVTGWSVAAAALYGYASDAVVGRSVSVLEPAPERGRFVQEVSECREPLGRFAGVHAARDGTSFGVEVTLAPQRGPRGEIVSVACLVRDTRSGERSGHELSRIADAAEQSATAIVSIDRERRIRHWSAGAERLLGVRAEQAVGLGLEVLGRALGVPDGRTEQARETFQTMLEGASPVHSDVQSWRADGSSVEIRTTFLPWREAGEIVGMTVVMSDITGRDAGALATARLAAIAEGSADAIMGLDRNGLVTSWNIGAEHVFGYAKSEILGRSLDPLVPEAHRAEFAAVVGRAFAGERVSEV